MLPAVYIKTLHFKKDTNSKWYIMLPEWEGDPGDLEMVSGADTWLDIVSGDGDDCVLYMSDAHFEGAHMMSLIIEKPVDEGGGGIYILHAYNAQTIDLSIWLCDVTRWVWGVLPPAIYFKAKTEL